MLHCGKGGKHAGEQPGGLGPTAKNPRLLGFEITGAKDGGAEKEEAEIEGSEVGQGFGDVPPWDQIMEGPNPACGVPGEEAALDPLKVRDRAQYEIHEEHRQRKNGRGGGLHVEARKGETERRDRLQADDDKENRAAKTKQAFASFKDAENLFQRREDEEVAEASSVEDAGKKARGGDERDKNAAVDRAGEPFDEDETKPRDGTGEGHAQRALFDLLGDYVARDEGEVKASDEENREHQHEQAKRQAGVVVGKQVTVLSEQVGNGLGRLGELHEQQNEDLDGQKRAEADMRSLSGEELPKFVLEMGEEHRNAGRRMRGKERLRRQDGVMDEEDAAASWDARRAPFPLSARSR